MFTNFIPFVGWLVIALVGVFTLAGGAALVAVAEIIMSKPDPEDERWSQERLQHLRQAEIREGRRCDVAD